MLIDKIKATVVNKIAVLKDINGNKIIPMTLTKAVQDDNGKKLNVILDEKMDKVDVVNVDTQVESDGKALNAVQLNPNVDGTLANKFEVLNNDRGYLTTKDLRNTDLNTIVQNGVYQFNPYPTLGNTNCPLQGEDVTFNMVVSGGGTTVITQLAIKDYPHTESRMFMRGCTNGVWGEWKELPSIDKVAQSKVLTTVDEVNNPNLESGIYSAEGEGVGMVFNGVNINYYYTLIVNQHRLNPNFGSQIAIPYDSGLEWGVYYRTCAAGTWQNWQQLSNETAYTTKITYFVEGETVLDFALNNTNSTKFVVGGGGFPTDLPVQAEGWVSVITDTPATNARKRVVFKQYFGTEYYRDMFNGEWRTEWQQIATTTKSTIKLTPLNGFGDWAEGSSAIKVGNVVTLTLKLASTSATISPYTLIAQLPEGYRPTKDCYGIIQQTVDVSKFFSVNTLGRITIGDEGWSNTAWHLGTITYVV